MSRNSAMYLMNQMYFFSGYWGGAKNIFGKIPDLAVLGGFGRFDAYFCGLKGSILGSFMYIRYIGVAMRRFIGQILMFDVPDVHECMYVMYKRFSKSVRFLMLWLSSWMYMRSTSMYIEDEKKGE